MIYPNSVLGRDAPSSADPSRDLSRIYMKIGFQNALSLRADRFKTLLLLEVLEELDIDVFGVAETWSSPTQMKEIQKWKEAKNFVVYTPPSQAQCTPQGHSGMAIFVKRSLAAHVINCEGDENSILINLAFKKRRLCLIFLHVPHQTQRQEELALRLRSWLLEASQRNWKTIVGGDFNDNPSESTNNKIFQILDCFQMLELWSLFHTSRAITHYQRTSAGMSMRQIDMFFCTPNLCSQMVTSEIHNDSIGADHSLITVSLLRPSTLTQTYEASSNVRRFLIDSMDRNAWREFTLALEKSQPITSTNIDKRAIWLNKTLKRAMMSLVPYKFKKPSAKPFFSKELHLLAKAIRSLRHNLTRYWLWDDFSAFCRKYPQWTSDFPTYPEASVASNIAKLTRHLRKKGRDATKAALKARWQDFSRLRSAFFDEGHLGKFMNMVAKKTILNGSIEFVKEMNNEKITIHNEPSVVRSKIHDYFSGLYQNELPVGNSPQSTGTFIPALMEPISKDSFTQALYSLSASKAPGTSEIPGEILKHMPRSLQDFLMETFNYCLLVARMPQIWLRNQIFCLPKGRCYDGDLNNLRPITLIETPRKLFMLLLMERLKPLSSKLSLNNFAFSEGQSTKDAITTLRILYDEAVLSKREIFTLFLDIKKAYDSVPLFALERAIVRSKLPESFRLLIRQTHTDRKTAVITPFGLTKFFRHTSGLQQGDPWSPLAWNLVYDELICILKESQKGFVIGDKRIPCLVYADDITLIADNEEDLVVLFRTVVRFLTDICMKINIQKSFSVSTSPLKSPSFHELGSRLTAVDDFTYLGTTFRIRMKGKALATLRKKEARHCWSNIRPHGLPAEEIRYLINSWLLPKIYYKFQTISYSENSEPDAIWLKDIKHALGSPKTLSNCSLWCSIFTDLRNSTDYFDCLELQYFIDSLNKQNLLSDLLRISLDKWQHKPDSYVGRIMSRFRFRGISLSGLSTSHCSINDLKLIPHKRRSEKEICIYTDGSVKEFTPNVCTTATFSPGNWRCGAPIRLPVSSFAAETAGIYLGTKLASRYSKILFKCDNKAVVDILNKGNILRPLRHTCGILWHNLFRYARESKTELKAEWIKGHSGIEGNEIADELANIHHFSNRAPYEFNSSDLHFPLINGKALHIPLKLFLKIQYKATMLHGLKESTSQSGPFSHKELENEQAYQIVRKAYRSLPTGPRKFILKAFFNLLPTSLRQHSWQPEIYPDSLCRRCNQAEEDQNHFLTCPLAPNIRDLAERVIYQAILKRAPDISQEEMDLLASNLAGNAPLELSTLYGLPSKTLHQTIYQVFHHPGITLACEIEIFKTFVSEIYQAIWKPRCADTIAWESNLGITSRQKRSYSSTPIPQFANIRRPRTSLLDTFQKTANDLFSIIHRRSGFHAGMVSID